MPPANLEQDLSAFHDLNARRLRWLELVGAATAEIRTLPASDQDSQRAADLWQYPTSLKDLEPQARLQWQNDAQARFNLRDDEFGIATEVNKRKLACKDRVRKAWGVELEDILKDYLTTGARGLGRSTLEILATIAEESELHQVESVLKDVVTERIDMDPHVGRSRKKKLTRQDVMDTRTRLKEQNSEPRNAELGTEDLANITGRRKRKRAASTDDSTVPSKDKTEPARRSTAPPTEPLTPAVSHASDGSHDTDERDGTDESPEIGRQRRASLPDFGSSLGGDRSSISTDTSSLGMADLGTAESHTTPKGQTGTSGRSLQIQDPLDSTFDDSLEMGYDIPEGPVRPCGESSSICPFASEILPIPDTSTMPLSEADGAVRKLAQAHFAQFFQGLKAIQELQESNAGRADNEVARIKALLDDKDNEAAICHATLKQASQALDAAEMEQRGADAECLKHEPLRALCQDNDFSESIRLALAQAEEELERLDQRLEDADKAVEDARAELQRRKDSGLQCAEALDTLRQEIGAAETVRDRCKITGTVLQGSRDEILSLSLGPRFPQNDTV